MGVGFSRELEELRRYRERCDRNKDMIRYREHQHALDVKRGHKATKNFKDLLSGQELRPLMNVCMSYLKEHTKHVKASRKRREIRFKEERWSPHPDIIAGPWMPPQQVYRREQNGPRRRYHSSPPGAESRLPPTGPPPDNIGESDPDEDDDHYGGGAGDIPPPSYHTHQRAEHGLRPPNDHAHHRFPPHRRGRRARPRHPDVDPRYMMHGGLGLGGEGFPPPPPERRPRGPHRTRGGHHGYGRDNGARRRATRHERGMRSGGEERGEGQDGEGGSGWEDEGPQSGSGSGQGLGKGRGSGAGSENSYGDGARRCMPPRRGMGRGGGSQ